MDLKNKKVTVVGLGRSGFAAAKFLWEQKADVRVTEAGDKPEILENAGYLRVLGVEVETGKHTEEFVSGSEWVVTSPGVPKNSLPLEWAKQKKISVISEVELASYFCQGRIVAVTGSNGKTTTCHLIYRVLVDAGLDCALCGNVGFSFLDALSKVNPQTIVVLELSSFQLEDSPCLKPEIAVVLNVSPNHLDRHGTLENYARAKENIFKNQTAEDTLVLNREDDRVKAMAKKARSRVVFFSASDALEEWLSYPLKGKHNRSNLMACSAVASLLGVSEDSMKKTWLNFKTLEHRIEVLGELNGVLFVNDSKSTTIESTRAAILTMDRPVVLVAGGRDKGASFAEVESALLERAKRVVLYGEAREKIAASWKKFKNVRKENDFSAAVRLALREAESGDCVLLSPMCTSFDQFSSFEQRGEKFKQLFETLGREAGVAECPR